VKPLLRCLSVILALGWSGAVAFAQDKNADIKKDDPVPPMTDTSKPDQNAKQEPSSKVPGTDGSATAFANGVLAVPGALTDVDTAPAKFSARTAGDDKLPTAGYRLKHLSAEQRTAILAQLGKGPAQSAPQAGGQLEPQVGAQVPATTALQDLKPLPDAVAAVTPDVKGLSFMTIGDKVVLIDPTMRIVVAVLT
jgi:hypothetical protein